MAGKSTDHERETDLRLHMVRQWYGDRIAQENTNALREGIEQEVVDVAESLRERPLALTDEPAPMFSPYREDR